MKFQTTLGLRAVVRSPICFAFSSDIGLRMRNEKGTQVRGRPSYLVMISSLIAALAFLSSCNGANGAAAALGDPPARVLSVTVTPAGGSLPLGEPQQFVATATLSDGSILDVTALALSTYSSSQGNNNQASTSCLQG